MLPNVSKRQLERFPLYLNYLKQIKKDGEVYISSSALAKALGLKEEKVRKDLQAVSKIKGKPHLGREIKPLIKDFESFLGYRDVNNAIIIGVGHLGEAFLNYAGFANRGLNIVAGFDVDDKKVGYNVNNIPIYHIDRLNDLISALDVSIAILTIPSAVAQRMSDILVQAGIKGIWNFAPTHLRVSGDVVVENVDLAASLAVLSYKLETKF